MKSDGEGVPVETIASLVSFDAASWDEAKDQLLDLERQAFGEKSFTEEQLKSEMSSPDAIVVALRDSGGKILGYTYGIPNEKDPESLHVCSTAVLPAMQGKGLVGKLLGPLEDAAREKGYKYITRNAAVSNGYADTVAKYYGDRIVETGEDKESQYGYGVQRFFKIRL